MADSIPRFTDVDVDLEAPPVVGRTRIIKQAEPTAEAAAPVIKRRGFFSTIDLPMTRTDIGDFLGLTIETVSRTFSKFKAMGVIELRQSSEVKIVDLDGLESLAAGDNDRL